MSEQLKKKVERKYIERIGWQEDLASYDTDNKEKVQKMLDKYKVPKHYQKAYHKEISRFDGLSSILEKEMGYFEAGGNYNPCKDGLGYEIRWNRYKNLWHDRFRDYLENDIMELPLIDKISLSNKPKAANYDLRQI